MTEASARSTGRVCEDCGGLVIAGREPIDEAREDSEVVATGVTTMGSEWCTNLDCSSNDLGGLHRIGVNRYLCDACGNVLAGPTSSVFAHRRTH